jgi:integrase
MSGRRRYGAVRQLPSGRWQARVRDEFGQLVSAPMTFPTKTDASRYLVTVETDQARGEWVDHRRGEVTVTAWVERWLGTCSHLRPKTRVSYDSLLRATINPHLGELMIGSLTPMRLREWVSALTDSGLSPSRVRQAYRLLSQALRVAEVERLIPRTPCIGVSLPKMPQTEPTIISQAQADAIASACPGQYGLLVRVLAYSGIRIGEALALRRSSVELDAARVVIRESLSDAGGRLIFTLPKDHQQRAVALPPFLVELLRTHLSDGVGRASESLVFSSRTGAPVRYSTFRRAAWEPALESTGLTGVTPHDLRASHASWLIDAGASVLDVAARLGHAAGTVTTRHYARVLPGRDAEVAQLLIQSGTDVARRPIRGRTVVPINKRKSL